MYLVLLLIRDLNFFSFIKKAADTRQAHTTNYTIIIQKICLHKNNQKVDKIKVEEHQIRHIFAKQTVHQAVSQTCACDQQNMVQGSALCGPEASTCLLPHGCTVVCGPTRCGPQ